MLFAFGLFKYKFKRTKRAMELKPQNASGFPQWPFSLGKSLNHINLKYAFNESYLHIDYAVI